MDRIKNFNEIKYLKVLTYEPKLGKRYEETQGVRRRGSTKKRQMTSTSIVSANSQRDYTRERTDHNQCAACTSQRAMASCDRSVSQPLKIG